MSRISYIPREIALAVVLLCASCVQEAIFTGDEYGWLQLVIPDGRTVLAALAICLAVYQIREAKVTKEAARRHSVTDDFWLRRVLAPLCVEPLVSFGEEEDVALQGLDDLSFKNASIGGVRNEQYLAHFDAFQGKCTSLRRRARFLAAIDNSLYTPIDIGLERLEDAVAAYCLEPRNRARHRPSISSAVSEIIREIIEAQKTMK